LLVNGAGKTPWKIGVISPVYDGSQPNSAFSATRYFAGLAPSLKDWKVKVQAHHYQDSTDLFSWRYELPPAGANTPIWVRDLDDHQSTGRTSYSLSASKPVALGGFGFNSYRIEQELDQTLTTSTETFLPNVTGQTDSHNFFYNHTVNNHNIRFGGELRKEKYDSFDEESLLSQSEEITDRGLYLEDQWSAGEKHYITAGLRYDDHSIAGGMFSPRFGVIKLLPPNMKLRVAYAEGFRPPGFLELYAPDTGNSDLDAEKGKQYEFAWSIVKGKNTVEVISFQYDIRNLIVLSDEGTPQYVNLDKTRQRGGEIVWQRQQSPKFSYALSYTYVSAENRITEERLPDIPRAMAAVTARYNFGKWQALLTGWYNDNHRLNAEVEVPERIVLDLSVVGSVNKLCQPYLIIRNLTNERLLQEEDDFTSDGRKIEVGLRSVW
jgi:outer membrane receptor protein involved in Fe transport